MKKTINLNDYRENIHQYIGIKPCPCYGEDGVFKKIFEQIGVLERPECIEFGELRSLGTTTRHFRVQYNARALYFSGTMDFYSIVLNVLDILKLCILKKSLKPLKFLSSMPYRDFAYPHTIGRKIKNFLGQKEDVDLVVVDIDSFDMDIVRGIFDYDIKPRVMVVEYNPSLPHDKVLYVPFGFQKQSNNLRLYGASYRAWQTYMEGLGYELVHISGFCNLIYIRGDISHPFIKPDIKEEITNTNTKILNFCTQYCLPGFVPSWSSSPQLTAQEIDTLSKEIHANLEKR